MADELGGLDLKDSLTKKIGGLPGFAWVGIGVGAVFLYKKYKGNSASSTPSASNATATTSATTNVGYSYDAAGNLVDANGNIIQYNNGSSIAGLGSNSIWASTAANQLAATGSYSASDIAAAISGLLNGSSLTPNQQSAANAATTIAGMPPTTNNYYYGTNPTPNPTPNTPLPAQQYVDQAGTIFTGGTVNSAGAISGATDLQGNKVFIPSANAPQISNTYVPTSTSAATPPTVVLPGHQDAPIAGSSKFGGAG